MDELSKLSILDFEDVEPLAIPITAGLDKREMPRYSVPEVSLYLHIPEKTLRSWLYGRPFPLAHGGTGFFKPLIEPADGVGSRLSFYNVVEAHILSATRKRDEVPMQAIRDAIDWADEGAKSKHPLITEKFLTEGRFLFQQRIDELLENASLRGQLAFAELMLPYLDRIDRDTIGPSALYPFVPKKPASKTVTIRPGVSSGVPTITGTGISIPILYGRYKAGDSIGELADDYELTPEQVEDAIAYIEAA